MIVAIITIVNLISIIHAISVKSLEDIVLYGNIPKSSGLELPIINPFPFTLSKDRANISLKTALPPEIGCIRNVYDFAQPCLQTNQALSWSDASKYWTFVPNYRQNTKTCDFEYHMTFLVSDLEDYNSTTTVRVGVLFRNLCNSSLWIPFLGSPIGVYEMVTCKSPDSFALSVSTKSFFNNNESISDISLICSRERASNESLSTKDIPLFSIGSDIDEKGDLVSSSLTFQSGEKRLLRQFCSKQSAITGIHVYKMKDKITAIALSCHLFPIEFSSSNNPSHVVTSCDELNCFGSLSVGQLVGIKLPKPWSTFEFEISFEGANFDFRENMTFQVPKNQSLLLAKSIHISTPLGHNYSISDIRVNLASEAGVRAAVAFVVLASGFSCFCFGRKRQKLTIGKESKSLGSLNKLTEEQKSQPNLTMKPEFEVSVVEPPNKVAKVPLENLNSKMQDTSEPVKSHLPQLPASFTSSRNKPQLPPSIFSNVIQTGLETKSILSSSPIDGTATTNSISMLADMSNSDIPMVSIPGYKSISAKVFRDESEIARGGFARIAKSRVLKNNISSTDRFFINRIGDETHVAVKYILPPTENEKVFKNRETDNSISLRFEIAILQLLSDRQGVVKFYGYIDEPMAIIMKCYDCTLYNLIHKRKTVELTFESKRSMLRDILEGLANIHSAKIIHFDIKPKNILISKTFDKRYSCVISDFGSARLLGSHLDKVRRRRRTAAGLDEPMDQQATLKYASPELLSLFTTKSLMQKHEDAAKTLVNQFYSNEDEIQSNNNSCKEEVKINSSSISERTGQLNHQKIDMWAFGLTAIELLQDGSSAWGTLNTEEIVSYLLSYIYSGKIQQTPDKIKKEIYDAAEADSFINGILSCLNIDHNGRPSSKELFSTVSH